MFSFMRRRVFQPRFLPAPTITDPTAAESPTADSTTAAPTTTESTTESTTAAPITAAPTTAVAARPEPTTTESPVQVATQLAQMPPAAREQQLAQLHSTLGNHFVTRVMGQIQIQLQASSGPASVGQPSTSVTGSSPPRTQMSQPVATQLPPSASIGVSPLTNLGIALPVTEEGDTRADIVAKYDEMEAEVEALYDRLIAEQEGILEELEAELAALRTQLEQNPSDDLATQVADLEHQITGIYKEIENLERQKSQAITELRKQRLQALAEADSESSDVATNDDPANA